MANAKSPAEALLDAIVARGVTPTLKAAGFRKTGRIVSPSSWRDRPGRERPAQPRLDGDGKGVLHQRRHRVRRHLRVGGVPLLDRPKEYECDERGFRYRLELLLPGSPDSWIVRAGEGMPTPSAHSDSLIPRLREELDRVDGLAAYRSHRWFDRFRPTRQCAQVLYLLGDRDGAWREVQALTVLFSDRPNANRAEWWVERLRLIDLRTCVTERDN